jgi:hypothetical protein
MFERFGEVIIHTRMDWGSAESFDDGVVKSGTDLLDGLVGAVRPRAIGEQSDGKLAVGIDPERSAGVAKVAEGGGAKIFSRLRRG